MYKKVLVPYDQSDPANHALREALTLLKDDPHAEITVLNVVEWHDFNAETFRIASHMSGVGEGLDTRAITDVTQEAAQKSSAVVEHNIKEIFGDDARFTVATIIGSPHDTITTYAEMGDFDCIIMGHRGLGAVRGMLGSVCYSVLHKANVPVLIVK